jgi:glucose-6-phosphate isomerase
MAAEQQATIDSLVAGKRPVRVIEIDSLSPACLGALFMHFTLETIIAADMLGIDAFDQPAVEDAKIRARSYLMDMD